MLLHIFNRYNLVSFYFIKLIKKQKSYLNDWKLAILNRNIMLKFSWFFVYPYTLSQNNNKNHENRKGSSFHSWSDMIFAQIYISELLFKIYYLFCSFECKFHMKMTIWTDIKYVPTFVVLINTNQKMFVLPNSRAVYS